MRRYQQEMETLLTGRKPRVLLHVCCAPCASAVLTRLAPHTSLTLLYYNPNIRPAAEHARRLAELRRLLAEMDGMSALTLLAPEMDAAAFDAVAAGHMDEPEGGARCAACFTLRLSYTARLAAAQSFDFFCTTLTVSPHKDAELINTIGEAVGAENGVAWLPADFKKNDGYRRSVALSAQYGLYRQRYCGCLPLKENT